LITSPEIYIVFFFHQFLCKAPNDLRYREQDGVDSAWEQRKLEARKMLENAAESHTSGARFVRCG